MSPEQPGPLADLNRIIRENRVGDYRSPNLALGMKPLEFTRGGALWSWQAQPELALNPFGTVQGGFLAVFVDELFSTAIGSLLEEGEWAVTAEMKLSYLRALRPGALEGSARVIRRTRALAFLEAQVAPAQGEVAITASATWSIARS